MHLFTVRPVSAQGHLAVTVGIRALWNSKNQRRVIALGGKKGVAIPVSSEFPRGRGMKCAVLQEAVFEVVEGFSRHGPHFEIVPVGPRGVGPAFSAALVRIDLRLPKGEMAIGTGGWQVDRQGNVSTSRKMMEDLTRYHKADAAIVVSSDLPLVPVTISARRGA